MLQNHVECSDVVLWKLLHFSEVILSVILMEAGCTTAKVFHVKGFVLIVIHRQLSCDHL